jgi:type I restriction enzyme, S subunit
MIGGLKPYLAYQDSGVPWLRKVPARWMMVRNARLFVQRNETGYPSLPILEVSLRTGVRVRNFDDSGRKQMLSDREKYKRAHQGDLAYNMMRMWQGAVGVAPVDGLVSPAYVVARPVPGVQGRYFAHVFRTETYMSEVDKYSHGIVKDRNRLYWAEFKQIPSPCPPPEEQLAIVHFLDHVERRIRGYIRAKRKLIALLNEQKDAVINRAVTRGLDPNVRVKQSGTEWLGAVPEHWEVTKLYRVTDARRPIMYGIVLPGPDVNDGVFIVKGGNCELGRLRPEFLSKTAVEIEARYARSRLRANDIVYAIRGSIGAAEVVPPALSGANLTQDAARIAPGQRIHPRWLWYAVQSPAFFAKLEAGAVGAAIRGINIRDLKRADLALPPLPEQETVASHLDNALDRTYEALARVQREVRLIREYHTRLITGVVTGELDVREVAAHLTEEPPEAGAPDEIEALTEVDEATEAGELPAAAESADDD